MQYFASISKKNRITAMSLLGIILLLILSKQFLEKKNYLNLDKSMHSLYTDRLIPLGHLFDMQGFLYKKETLQLSNRFTPADQQHFDTSMHTLISQYETTFLTAAEKAEWLAFKEYLHLYNKTAVTSATGFFEQAIQKLEELNHLQIKVGNQLQQEAKEITASGQLQSYFEMMMLCIVLIGIIILINQRYIEKQSFHFKVPLN
ncbi:MAG: MCP four helix bundle domain-containing protein [Filimonas sp.]|nr:MCP four helix bundle domain-containing protein [Filimonas sp.]